MKRLFAVILVIIQLAVLSSCKSVELPKKDPPPIPAAMRSKTVITADGLKTEAVTDLCSDGTVEFMLTGHETLNGIVFRSEPSGFKVLADGIEVDVSEADLLRGSVFPAVGKALRAIHKTLAEPIRTGNLYEYEYADFIMVQNGNSGEIMSIRFKEKAINVDFISIK